MKILRSIAVASAAFFYVGTASAQWQVPDHSIPVGRGSGTGFKFAAPGTAGQALVSNGASSDPSFQAIAGPAFGTQAANTHFSGPTSGGAATPAFRALVGADLPNPSASTLGGVQSLTCAANQWLNSISVSGVPACAQPAFSNISGTATAAQGGTGLASYAVGDILYAATTTTLARLADIATGNVLRSGGVGVAPAWGKAALGTDVSGTLPIANGGTGQTTAAAARASSGINVDQFTGHGDSIYTILATDRTVGTNAAFTASRTWTLPAANAVNPGQEIVVADFQGTVTASNTLVVQRAGADTVNGGTSVTITAANGAYLFKSDGISKWTAQALGAAAAGGVSSVTCGQGMTGGTITTSGTCAVALSSATTLLPGDVPLGAINTLTDVLSVAVTAGQSYLVNAQITLVDSGAISAGFQCKLYDGSTTFASSPGLSSNAGSGLPLLLPITAKVTPGTATIKVACRDISSANGIAKFNYSGLGGDSSITITRIQ